MANKSENLNSKLEVNHNLNYPGAPRCRIELEGFSLKITQKETEFVFEDYSYAYEDFYFSLVDEVIYLKTSDSKIVLDFPDEPGLWQFIFSNDCLTCIFCYDDSLVYEGTANKYARFQINKDDFVYQVSEVLKQIPDLFESKITNNYKNTVMINLSESQKDQIKHETESQLPEHKRKYIPFI